MGCSTGLFATGLPCPSARRSPRWVRRATPFGFALAEALNSLYKAELIRNQGPWEDIDAARARHRRVGALVQHHSPSLRHRYANPCRARSRLGTRHPPRPPPPGTTTTGNHRNHINQPPQNPAVDKVSLARALCLVGVKGYITNIPSRLIDATEVVFSYHTLWYAPSSHSR